MVYLLKSIQTVILWLFMFGFILNNIEAFIVTKRMYILFQYIKLFDCYLITFTTFFRIFWLFIVLFHSAEIKSKTALTRRCEECKAQIFVILTI